MANHEANGMELLKKAEKKLKGGFMASMLGGKKYDEATELLEKAVTQFKLAKAWPVAARTYIQLAEVNAKNDNEHEAASNYVDAAKCYINNKQQADAQQCLQKAVEQFTNIGRLSQAARYLRELGENLEKDGQPQAAVEVYLKAIDLFVAENQQSEANKCRLKVAQYQAEAEQYEDAYVAFETVAQACVESNLLKFGAKEHLLNALLCRLCAQTAADCRDALMRYEDIDISLANSRQHKLGVDILEAVEAGDVQRFTDTVAEYDRLTKLEPWRTTILLRIKQRIEGGLGGEEEDDEDFT